MNCLVPDCLIQIHSRGLCESHYNQVSRLVRLKKTTWEQLVKQGKVLNVSGTNKEDLKKSEDYFLSDSIQTRIRE